MIIKIITREPFPNGRAASCRIKNLAWGLSENGYKCEVIVTRRTETNQQIRNNKYSKGRLSENITYEYLTKDTHFCNTIRATIQNIFEPLLTFIHCVKKNDSDTIVIFYGQRLFLEIFIGLACLITKSIFCKDLVKYPYLKDERPTIKSWITFHIIFKAYNAFIVICDDLEKIANKYKRAKSKIIRIPILLNTSKVCEQTIQKPKYIFHSGSLTENKDGFCGILEAFGKTRILSGTDIDLYVTGNFDSITNKELATKIIEKYKLQHCIKFMGYINEDDVLKYQNGSLLFWINMHDTTTNKYCFPTKLGEYLFSGNPVIITDIGTAPKYLKNEESAYIVPANDTESMANIAVRIINNPKEAENVGANGKKIATCYFDCFKQCQKLASFFLDLINVNDAK